MGACHYLQQAPGHAKGLPLTSRVNCIGMQNNSNPADLIPCQRCCRCGVTHLTDVVSLCLCSDRSLVAACKLQLKLCINLPLFFGPLACALVHGHRAEAICSSNSEAEIPETAFRGQRRIANDTFAALASYSGILGGFLYELGVLIQSADKV